MRTLFILVTVLCVLLVPLSVKVYKARQQRLAVQWVLENDGYIMYDYQLDEEGTYVTEIPTDNLWLRSVLGNDLFDTPVDVTLGNPAITDISNLSHLQSLETVHLIDPENVDLSPLSSLRNLDSCMIEFSSEKSFTAKHIAELSKLDCSLTIYLDGQFMQDLTLIQQLSNVRVLGIYNSQISDLSPLIQLDQLENLNIQGPNVTDLTPLAKLINLRDLKLNTPKVKVLAPLQNLVNLEDLRIHGATVTDITPFAKLVNLQYLSFRSSKIKDLSPLENLTSLETLSLDCSEITDLTPLAKLVNLRFSRLDTPKANDLSPLFKLSNLENLTLVGMELQKAEIDKLQKALPNCVIKNQ
ncbi:MAG: hypothetical protein COA78_15835 [Blastopirellula sp.]|nr:MAG: hypothetical protein COA78_15835 [Blastopirellula sp.]